MFASLHANAERHPAQGSTPTNGSRHRPLQRYFAGFQSLCGVPDNTSFEGFWTSAWRLSLSCLVLCGTLQNRLLPNDGHRRIAQRIDVDGAAYGLHGHKLAGRAFNRFRLFNWFSHIVKIAPVIHACCSRRWRPELLLRIRRHRQCNVGQQQSSISRSSHTSKSRYFQHLSSVVVCSILTTVTRL